MNINTEYNSKNFFVTVPAPVLSYILGFLGPRSFVPQKAVDFDTKKVDDQMKQLRESGRDICNFLDTCSGIRNKIIKSENYNVLSARKLMYEDLELEKDTVNEIFKIYHPIILRNPLWGHAFIEKHGKAKSLLFPMMYAIGTKYPTLLILATEYYKHKNKILESVDTAVVEHFRTIVDHISPITAVNRLPIDYAAWCGHFPIFLIQYMMEAEHNCMPGRKEFYVTEEQWMSKEQFKGRFETMDASRREKIKELCNTHNYYFN